MRNSYNAVLTEQKKRTERVQAANFNANHAERQKKVVWQSHV